MVTQLKPIETYRDDFTFRNSPEAIARFPFPFAEDQYRYSVNLEPHTKGAPGSAFEFPIDIDEHYVSECAERAIVLDRDPKRYVALPHMVLAQWDTLELLMESMARDYPHWFQLTRDGDHWHWVNQPLGIEQSFTFGDMTTLPREPLDYILRQVQGDFVAMDQRDDDLWADAGMITGPADWSMTFDAGMSFKEWHGPVPIAHEIGVFDRALKYLLALRQGAPVRRLNWTLTIHPRLDASPEMYPSWGVDRSKITPETLGETLNLRVELQALFRLPRSNGMLFSIRTYLASFDELATNPAWVKRLHRVLATLPPPVVEYKGFSRFYDMALEWLRQYDPES
jgi:hypothetical protein